MILIFLILYFKEMEKPKKSFKKLTNFLVILKKAPSGKTLLTM